MVYYLLLLCAPFVCCCQSVFQKQYTTKHERPNVILFSALTSLIALCFFFLTSGFELTFDVKLLPYSLGFAVCYASAWVGTVLAVQYGSMAISSLIVSFSLVFPTVYGIMLGEAVTPAIIIGAALLFAAMLLVNLKPGKKETFSVKWFVCVMVAFLGNGVCSICSNMQKRTLGDAYTHEFMIIALAAAFLLLMSYVFMTSKNVVKELKICLPYAAGNGIANAIVNFLILTIIGNIPNTVLYPTNSALNMILMFLLSFIVYKERFSKMQYVGYALGVVSIVLLNI